MRTGMLVIGTLAIAAGFANAQNVQTRRAAMVGGGNANSGKCTVDIIVDGSAQVEVRGDSATLRNTGGQAPQWRRFECTGAMPANPANFRFVGVDGRGRQTLARDPRNNGGAAVVQIEDSDAGSEGYTFDLFWGGEPPVTGGFQGGRGSVPPTTVPSTTEIAMTGESDRPTIGPATAANIVVTGACPTSRRLTSAGDPSGIKPPRASGSRTSTSETSRWITIPAAAIGSQGT